jgi:serpin B
MKTYLAVTCYSLAFLLNVCLASSTGKLADSINQLALELIKISENSSNYFISPYSIATALSLCYPGARGETKSELKNLLAYTNLTDQAILGMHENFHTGLMSLVGGKVTLDLANKIFPQKGWDLNKDYINAVKKYFKSEVEIVDFGNAFEAAGIINKWVKQKTHDKIKDLIPANSLSDLTKMILVNAIYFKGEWQIQFNKQKTSQEDFHLTNGSTIKVDMMKLSKKILKYLANPVDLEASVLELPYAGANFSMTIILPNANVSLSKIENDLTWTKIKKILESNKDTAKVNVYLPKFKFEFKKEVVIWRVYCIFIN